MGNTHGIISPGADASDNNLGSIKGVVMLNLLDPVEDAGPKTIREREVIAGSRAISCARNLYCHASKAPTGVLTVMSLRSVW
jgi:hypothetical protein